MNRSAKVKQIMNLNAGMTDEKSFYACGKDDQSIFLKKETSLFCPLVSTYERRVPDSITTGSDAKPTFSFFFLSFVFFS
jgi:hypothetical protein